MDAINLPKENITIFLNYYAQPEETSISVHSSGAISWGSLSKMSIDKLEQVKNLVASWNEKLGEVYRDRQVQAEIDQMMKGSVK